MKMKISLLCLFALFACFPSVAHSHPHVWTDYVVHPTFNAQGLEGFRIEWTFDEMFSMQIMEMVGLRSGDPSAAQVRQIREDAFENLRHYNYFIHVWVDGKSFQFGEVRDFNARVKNNRIIYDFFIPCAVDAAPSARAVRLQVRDPEIFVDFTMASRDPVRIVNPAGVAVEYEIGQESLRAFGVFFTPKSVDLTFRK